MTTVLPFELWTQILEHAIVTHIPQSSHYDPVILPHPVVPRQYVGWPSKEKQVALKLALVCREFREVVRPILFEVIHFTKSSSVWRFADLLDNIFTNAGIPHENGPRLWTKHLSFDFEETNPNPTYRVPMCRIFKHCTNVIGVVSKIDSPDTILGMNDQSDCAAECIPRGSQFFCFQSIGWMAGEDSFNTAVLRLNSDSLRVVETEDASEMFHSSDLSNVSLAKVTHLRAKTSTKGRNIQAQHLPLLAHLHIYNGLDPFDNTFAAFHDKVISFHSGPFPLVDVQLQTILQRFRRLHTLGFHSGGTHGILLQPTLSAITRQPYLRHIHLGYHDSFRGRSLKRVFRDLKDLLVWFTGSQDVFPALETITVSCHFSETTLTRWSADITATCVDLSKGLGSSECRVLVRVGSNPFRVF
ncbi:hypothetical protein BD410DRAFT_586811 [Rickenella mellea]|uniref:F-box domain-containing protein n=1 Tax=Rickenella mellea TaxID=50990 RepID=A0A4Y7PQW5_9AGAM|nr:hypothetical protein BD410DRAFT_586811 [Rickenella mellea]